MKILDRIGLAVFSMITLVISVVLILIGFGVIEPTIFGIIIGKVIISQQYTYIMIGICVCLTLLAVKCLFFGQASSWNDDEGVLLQNSDGKLLITKNTILNIVEGITGEFPSIEHSEVEVKFDKENNIIINIALDVKKDTIIKELSAKLQNRVKKEIKASTTLDLNSVDIEIHSIEKEEQTNEDNMKNKEGV